MMLFYNTCSSAQMSMSVDHVSLNVTILSLGAAMHYALHHTTPTSPCHPRLMQYKEGPEVQPYPWPPVRAPCLALTAAC
jgi:hypothetical protein